MVYWRISPWETTASVARSSLRCIRVTAVSPHQKSERASEQLVAPGTLVSQINRINRTLFRRD